MDAAEKQKLMEWMKAAIELETEIATQESVINCYCEQHSTEEPKLQLLNTPSQPVCPEHVKNPARFFIKGINAKGLFILLAGSYFLFAVIFLFNNSEERFDSFSYFIGFSVAGLLCLIPVFISNLKTRIANGKLDRQYSYAMEDYRRKLGNANAENERRQTNYQHDYELWRENREANLDILNRELQKSKNLLTQLYAQQYMYPKYCTLPALTSIYEYFITGRCDELTGPHGAYNMYEDELRKDMVISQLNVVIEHLEQIKQNQYMLYQQVRMIQQDTARINQEMSQIKGLTFQIARLSTLNTYYAAITARNSQISATFHLLNG